MLRKQWPTLSGPYERNRYPVNERAGYRKDTLVKVAELSVNDDTYHFRPKEAPKETMLELLYRAYEQ